MNLHHRCHRGFTLVEMVLFFALLGIMSVTLTSVYIAVQSSRIEQQHLSETEQMGTIIMESIAQKIRKAEKILLPISGSSGSTLALQMASASEHPTIFSRTSTGRLLLATQSSVTPLLGKRTTATAFRVTSILGSAVRISLTLTTTSSALTKNPYVRHFESTVLLSPDSDLDGGGCGTCAAPACVLGSLQWYECSSGACVLSSGTMPC